MSEMLNASHKKEINEAYFHLSTAPRIFNNQLIGRFHTPSERKIQTTKQFLVS